jgi:hypothetical protein
MPSLNDIKQRAKNPQNKPPLAVNSQGEVTTDGNGTTVPKGTFHFFMIQ